MFGTQLKVEVGRHNNIDYNQRLCILCDKREVEDEFHFVMKCPVYQCQLITFTHCSIEVGTKYLTYQNTFIMLLE